VKPSSRSIAACISVSPSGWLASQVAYVQIVTRYTRGDA
jgi:hypothetical protein